MKKLSTVFLIIGVAAVLACAHPSDMTQSDPSHFEVAIPAGWQKHTTKKFFLIFLAFFLFKSCSNRSETISNDFYGFVLPRDIEIRGTRATEPGHGFCTFSGPRPEMCFYLKF